MPYLLAPPLPQTIAAGADINASAVIQAHPPPFLFRWQRANTASRVDILTTDPTNFVSFNSTALGYSLSGAQISNSFNLRLFVTNLATGTNFLLLTNLPSYAGNNLNVTVLLDTDHDGIPDKIESALGLGTNNAADALLDLDGDGMSNLAEYLAGTDLNDPNSFLRIVQTITPGAASVNFGAVSNRTYTVQYTDVLSAASWQTLADIMSRPSNRVEALVDPAWTPKRFYRVVTPRQP